MITFFSLVPGGLQPCPASKSAEGSLPTRGFRYCEALRQASSFGWYVYLPMDLWLVFDGTEVEWSIDQGQSWYPLVDAVQYPHFSNQFDTAAPDHCKGYAPPFLTRTPSQGVVQIWTGVVATTEPGLSSLIRGPANLNWRNDLEVFEGIIETDQWFGPLFTNVKLHKVDKLVTIRGSDPFLQLQPVPKNLVAQMGPRSSTVRNGLGEMDEEAWSNYRSTVVRRMQTQVRPGDYAVETRKRATAN